MKPPSPQPLGLVLCVALTAALAGCAGAPQAATPSAGSPALAPVPAAWQAPIPATAAATGTDLARWWAGFGDPVLSQLIDSALAASPTLAAARSRIDSARAGRVAAGAAALPQLDAVATAQGGRSQPRQPNAGSASVGLQAGWELDLFGGVQAGRGAAQARLEGAVVAAQAARVSLAAEVATSYVQLRACQAQWVQARLDAASREETSRLTELSARAGFTAPADAALARASAAQSRSLALARLAQCETAIKGLVETTAMAEPHLRALLATGTATLPQAAAIAVQALPADVLAQRPDVAEAARTVEAAAGEQRATEAREKPQVRLSGSLGAGSLRSGGITQSGSTWALGPVVVTLPLFDGGSSAANSAAAKTSYEAAVAEYQAQVRRALREVETAFVALDSTAARQQDAEAAARDFEASLVATQARQRSGLASLFDLESARRNAVLAQSALIDLQTERVSAWISLYRALGGGWASSTGTALVPPSAPTAVPPSPALAVAAPSPAPVSTALSSSPVSP